FMEWDDGEPEATRGLVKVAVVASATASTGLPRDQRVARLIRDMRSALAIPTGLPSADDTIDVAELQLSALDLILPFRGPQSKTLSFPGRNPRYSARFTLRS
ncbi:hypothetical protein BG015_005140, partial [Linnemannia schmuckeri]